MPSEPVCWAADARQACQRSHRSQSTSGQTQTCVGHPTPLAKGKISVLADN